ncbi:hypothetical protein [Natronohydrobacter thiooxidans]|uniref:preprotein translocase subunit SecA n=1 Tax=Natronohydrobacter thiooxidans TaxID=87172 RepID=UPI000A00E4B0|nr:hypothetical protein [Natronohydrobacter thiooxidans]
MITLRPALRPWMTGDRSASALPERAWPKLRWWDRLGCQVENALRPAISELRPADHVFARRVIRQGRRVEGLTDAELSSAAQALRPALLREGLRGRAAVMGFALAREASFRVLGFRHHPVQIIGAARIMRGALVEMATGEGKTATTALAAATVALAGIPVHVLTVNEYLRARDFETLAPIYARLGLRAAEVDPDQDEAAKAAAYQAEICHVTHKTLVFDYMRARLGQPALSSAQRLAVARLGGARTRALLSGPGALGFAILDEADSVLIDEAQTPLIIAAPEARSRIEDCRFALELAAYLVKGRDFTLRADARRIDLTEGGKRAIARAAAANGGLWAVPRAREELAIQALSAMHLYQRDQHYIVTEDKVQIVDEFTGRVLADRQWQAGLHQMIEAREGLELSAERNTLAQITFQSFFRRYLWFGGMSGTIAEVSRECRHVYDRPVCRVPTHRRSRRRNLGTRLMTSTEAKLVAVARRAQHMAQARGRPVLIGTRSVDISERLSEVLTARGAAHKVLNARQDSEEAAIIAGAGAVGQITIATNMAGRGTDIKLSPAARAAGGLHVILTEFHESRRVDRQLFGRAARQGDPGSIETIVALRDPLFERFAGGAVALIAYGIPPVLGRYPGILAEMLRRIVQARAERLARRNRAATLRRSEKLASLLAFTRQTGL